MYTKTQSGDFIIAGIIGKIEHKTVGDKQSSLTKFSVKVGEKAPTVEGERGEAIWTNCDAWHAASRLLQASGAKKGDGVFCSGKMTSREYEGKTYKTLNVDFVIPAIVPERTATPATTAAASAHPELGDLSEFEELMSDGDVPF